MWKKRALASFVFLFLPALANAGILDMNFVYSSDTAKTATSTTSTLMAYDFSIGIPIGKRDLFVSFNYGAYNSTLTTTTSTTWSGTDMGLKISGFFGRGRLYTSSFTYNFKSIVSYNSGTTTELRGTSMKADFGVNYWMSDGLALSLKFFYYAPTMAEQVDSTTLTKVAYGRTSLGQGLGLSWIF